MLEKTRFTLVLYFMLSNDSCRSAKMLTPPASVFLFFFFFAIQVSRPRWPLTAYSSNANYKLLLNNYTTVTNNYFKRSRTKYKQKL